MAATCGSSTLTNGLTWALGEGRWAGVGQGSSMAAASVAWASPRLSLLKSILRVSLFYPLAGSKGRVRNWC